jgi:dipeptidyl aminopeptidase/acylaminoacyl peptidase
MFELIPREVLFGNPERVSPAISPDGTRLAWIAPHEGVLNVWVAPATAGLGVDWSAARVVTDDRDRGIRMFAWAHDGRHLLYLQDTGGDENWRLHDVDLETMDRRDLTPFDGVQARVVAMERKFPTELLVALNRDNPELHDVYRLDLVTGELTKVVENPGFIGFLADAQLAVKATIAPQPDGSLVLMVRDSAEADWRPLLTVPADDALTSDPIAFSEDGGSLLGVSSVGANTGRLVRIDVTTGAEEVLAADPEADVSDVRIQPDTRQPQIVTFT